MDTQLWIGGTSLVILTGAAAALQVTAPELLPVLCPLSLALGSTAYLAARPDVRARIVRALPAPRPRLLTDSGSMPPVDAGLDTVDTAWQTQVLAALDTPVTAPALAVPAGARDAGLLDTLLAAAAVAAPAPRPPRMTITLAYAPGMATRWMTTLFPGGIIDSPWAYAAHTPRQLAQRLHEMLVRGSVTITRLTLGCALHEADQVGTWTAALVICDAAPDAVLHTRLLAHFQAVAVQPYSRGGTALVVVLAQPAGVTVRAAAVNVAQDTSASLEIVRANPRDTDDDPPVNPDQAMPPPDVVTTADGADLSGAIVAAADQAPAAQDAATDGDAYLWADDEPSDATAATDHEMDVFTLADPDPLPVQPSIVPVVPAPEQFLAYERAPQPVTPPPSADLRAARALWTPGANLPQLHFGVHPHSGDLITGPLEPTCLFVPSQRGKTTLLMYLLHQTLLAVDPATGDGIAPWFMTTKWQDTTMHGVQIGRWLRQAYNLTHFDAPHGVEPDGIGTLRMLRLLERELNARLTPGAAHPRTPIVAMVDEWAYTVAVLEQKRFKQDARRKAKATDGSMTPFDPLVLEDAQPKTPLDAAALAVKRLIRQGFGERMVLFLATQDGQVQNNGDILNTGVLGSFSTYLCHTECDAPTFRIIAKGDPARLETLHTLRRNWQGWIYVREQRIEPLTFPHVTDAVIDQWLDERPVAPRVPVVLSPAPRSAPSPVTSPAVTVDAWPESVRAAIAKLPPAQLRAFVAAFAQIGVAIPLRVTEGQRHGLLGLGPPAAADRRLIALLYALATKAHEPMSLNQLAALVFGRAGPVSVDIGRMVRAHQEQD